MKPLILSGRANPGLARSIADALGVALGRCDIEIFPDNEYIVEIHDDAQGRDLYLIQPTQPPVADNLMELMLLADAGRRAGAGRITAVIPYYGYARQDRREAGQKPLSARLVADILCTRMDRLVTVHLHNPAIEGFFPIPVHRLAAFDLMAAALADAVPADTGVIVAPDLGAVKMAHGYADILNMPVVVIHKVRESGKSVSVRRIIGDVKDRSPILVDDMISTGGTIAKATEALLEAGCRPEITVAATHGLMVGDCLEKFARLPIRRTIISDSIGRETAPQGVQVVGLGKRIAETISRLNRTAE